MRQLLRCIFLLTLGVSACFPQESARAEFEWSVLQNIPLDEKPRDVVMTPDGTTAYVLCDTRIQIISLTERKIIGSLPVGGGYSGITIAPSGTELILAGSEKKQLTVVEVSQVHDIPEGTSPVIGNRQAPVTLTAFLDYQCPYCSKAYPLLEQMLSKYPKEVKLLIKHYPLKFHAAAEPASMAALAAASQNKYKELSAVMMQQSNKLSAQAIRQAAIQAGLNMAQFDAAVQDPAVKQQIADDMRLGSRCNVRGVPSIYINGRPIKSYTVESFSASVERELKKQYNRSGQ